MKSAILFAIVMNAKCSTGCLFEGYNGGYFKKPDKCICQEVFEVEDMMRKRQAAPRKEANFPSELDLSYPYSYSPKKKMLELD